MRIISPVQSGCISIRCSLRQKVISKIEHSIISIDLALLFNYLSHSNVGAQEKTRTSTTLRSLAPEASASTNSATWALEDEISA